ncbi:CcdB family protein [Prosthecomicrobium pneumaticum]|uniref:Toxin CcdB n=1 Tax=Prosthecomicrobium pneumaticum TaxID=81895 RepID=A0A7W9FQP5_9HYPH|nr:CcdB family protein [Prosthecomicrobium pneumaticum]MBB5754991.1 hypothetical protein [Prosthecomicrobium pneumaticum]
MRQFDVCRLRRDDETLVVLLQHDVADGLDTRIVAPVSFLPYRDLVGAVRLAVDVAGRTGVVLVDRLAAIECRSLGPAVASIAHEQDRLKRAIDLLFLGI